MAENVSFKTNVEKGAAHMKDTSEKFSAAADSTTKMVENAFTSATKGIKDYNCKAIEFAQANSDAAFDYAKHVMNAKSFSDMMELWTKYAHNQFDALAEQTKELSVLGESVATKSAEPFSKRSH